jgi:glycyl-tRNA synthetase (class II)
MPSFKNLKELEKYINEQAKKALQNGKHVKNTVIETGKKHVDKDVYSVYTPKIYERTGLLRESWDVENTDDGIAVFNTRTDGEKYIPEVIETGIGYDYTGYGYAYENPRPFISNAREELHNSNALKEAMKKDLKDAGFDVE